MVTTQATSSDSLLWDVWMSTLHLAAVTVADEIKVFEQLKNSDLTFLDISSKLHLELDAVKTLCELLIALGFLVKHNEMIQLSQAAKLYLLSDSPYYRGGLLHKLRTRNDHKRILNAMLKNDGLLAHNGKTFSNMWEDGSISPEAAAQFTAEMHATIFSPAVAAIKTDMFCDIHRLLDVGGGSGCFSICFTQEYPNKKSTIFELPEVAQISQRYIQHFKAEKDVLTHTGSFFKEIDWPKEHDGILLSQILHDWPISVCKQILAFAYQSLSPGGKIFIYEMLLEDQRTSPLTTACFNMLMFINHRSQQFSSIEITQLLQDVGFTDIIIRPTFGYFSLIIGKK